jgi:hypothetical protein
MSSSHGDHELQSLSQVDNDLVRHKSTTPPNPAQTAAARPTSASASQASNKLAKLDISAQTASHEKLINPRRGDHELQKQLSKDPASVTRPEGFRGTRVLYRLESKDYMYVEKVCGADYEGAARLPILRAHFHPKKRVHLSPKTRDFHPKKRHFHPRKRGEGMQLVVAV